MQKELYAVLILAGSFFLAGCASTMGAQQAAGNPDENFMVMAAQLNLAEIATGRLATQLAENSDVRQYGARMVQDHSRAGDELTQLAERRDVTLPERPDEAHMQMAEHLSQLEGQEFDREYMSAMVADHEKTLSLFQDKARTAEDPELRSWAAQMVPTLQDHAEMARMLQRQLERTSPAVLQP